MDETHVDGEFVHRKKRFSSSKFHHGGFISTQKGSWKHLTAVLVVSASGHLAPLFAIAAGKNVMDAWSYPLLEEFFKSLNGVPHYLAEHGWLHNDSFIRCTGNGCEYMATMKPIVEHMNNFVRQFVRPHKHVVSFLYGHPSRKVTEWIEVIRHFRIEVVVLPAHTTQFYSPVTTTLTSRFKALFVVHATSS